MSVEAIHWALNAAPIPRDRRDASSLAIVLVGLANHADSDGHPGAIMYWVDFVGVGLRPLHPGEGVLPT